MTNNGFENIGELTQADVPVSSAAIQNKQRTNIARRRKPSLRVGIFSMGPVFPKIAHGGSQRTLVNLLSALQREGAEADVLCPARPDNSEDFNLGPGIRVMPRLPLKQPFPMPYRVPPPNLANAINMVRKLADSVDVLYFHDSQYFFRDSLPEKPLIYSIRDLVYQESIIGAFLYSGDRLIVPSSFIADCLLATVGQTKPRLAKEIVIAPHGVDTRLFRPIKRQDALRRLNVPAECLQNKLVLNFVHRPEPDKGFDQLLTLVSDLNREKDVVILIPKYFDPPSEVGHIDPYAVLLKQFDQAGLRNTIRFMPWQDSQGLACLYALSDVTLCTGVCPESYGNVAYESLSCGTPVVAFAVGAYKRGLIGFPGAYLVRPIDSTAAVNAVLEASKISLSERREIREYIVTNADSKILLREYARLLFPPLNYLTQDTASCCMSSGYRLAPWCSFYGDSVFHDFLGKYFHLPILASSRLLNDIENSAVSLSNMPESLRVEVEYALASNLLIWSP